MQLSYVRTPDVVSKKGFRYRISQWAHVQSIDEQDRCVRTLTQHIHNGYMEVKLGKKSYKVHQLMVFAGWVCTPDSSDHTWTPDHLNNDSTNNSAHNLRLASLSMQSKNRRPHSCTMLVSCPVIVTAQENIYKQEGETNKLILKEGNSIPFASYREAMQTIPGSRDSHISSCLTGRRKKHAKCIWSLPLEEPDFISERWILITKNRRYSLYNSNYGRTGYKFTNGYFKKVSSVAKTPERYVSECDPYPSVMVNGKQYLHLLTWKTHVGPIFENYIVDHIDNNKRKSQLSNLQLLTRSENALKIYNNSLTFSCASYIDGKPETVYDSREDAVKFLQSNGFPSADIEGIEEALLSIKKTCTIMIKYGRSWVQAGIKTKECVKIS